MIENSHNGKVNDTRRGGRMRSYGNIAGMENQPYKKYGKINGLNAERWEPGCCQFRRPAAEGESVPDQQGILPGCDWTNTLFL
jgi:hypothetical protein